MLSGRCSRLKKRFDLDVLPRAGTYRSLLHNTMKYQHQSNALSTTTQSQYLAMNIRPIALQYSRLTCARDNLRKRSHPSPGMNGLARGHLNTKDCGCKLHLPGQRATHHPVRSPRRTTRPPWPPQSKPSMRKSAPTSTPTTSARPVRTRFRCVRVGPGGMCAAIGTVRNIRRNRGHNGIVFGVVTSGLTACEQISGVPSVTLVFPLLRSRI